MPQSSQWDWGIAEIYPNLTKNKDRVARIFWGQDFKLFGKFFQIIQELNFVFVPGKYLFSIDTTVHGIVSHDMHLYK